MSFRTKVDPVPQTNPMHNSRKRIGFDGTSKRASAYLGPGVVCESASKIGTDTGEASSEVE